MPGTVVTVTSLSLTEKHHVGLSSTRLCGTSHVGAQEFPAQQCCRCSSSVNMRRTLTCSIWVPAGLLSACFSCGQERTLVHRCCPERRVRKAMPPFVFDDDDVRHIWPGDTDFLHASDKLFVSGTQRCGAAAPVPVRHGCVCGWPPSPFWAIGRNRCVLPL